MREVPSLGALIRQVAVVCHHGGMGTLGQAMAAGVPQVVIAQGGDRPDNATRLQQSGIAEFIRPRERAPERVAAALQRMVGSAAIKQRCLDIAASVQPDRTLELISGFIQGALVSDEFSFKSARCVSRI